jgi:hypothetical protein
MTTIPLFYRVVISYDIQPEIWPSISLHCSRFDAYEYYNKIIEIVKSHPNCLYNEVPVHNIRLDAPYIHKTVILEQFVARMYLQSKKFSTFIQKLVVDEPLLFRNQE